MRAKRSSRREFLRDVSLGSLLVAGSVESARGYAANDTLEIGCIGTGGRCQHLLQSLVKVPGVRVAAACDVWDVHLERGKAMADPQAFATKKFQELLDRKDLDAVLIATPDHQHVPITIASCQAGKHVYVEKPLTHDLAEGKLVIDEVRKSGKVVQVGTQQRSMPHFRKARELLKGGRIGQVFKVQMSWNRNAVERFSRTKMGVDPNTVAWKDFLGPLPDQPFDEFKFRNWRWFWDFGGGLLTDLMVHWLDVALWFLDLDMPEKATAIGNYIASKDAWETPDTIQCLLGYPGNVQMHFEGTFSNARNAAMIEFMGTQGTLYLDRGRYEIYPERGGKGEPEAWILSTNPARGRDFYEQPDGELLHLTDWVDAIRRNREPNAPVEAGVRAAAAAQLGNLAYREGRVATWPLPPMGEKAEG